VTNSPPRLFDRGLHGARLSRAAPRFARADFLKRRAVDDVVERLAATKRNFPTAIDLGARNGLLAKALSQSGRPGQIGWLMESDLSWAMLARPGGAKVVVDEESLPFSEGCADLIVSTLALHWVNDMVGALIQIRRALKPDGLFLGALLGGATLLELRQALTEADLERIGGAGPRVSPFIDAGDVGDLMRRAGFALPVVDVDRVTVRYASPLALLADLRAMGETNVLFERSRAPLSRSVLARASEIYLDRFAGPDGRAPATFEIIGLTGWAPHPDQPKPLKRGSATARLEEALAKVRGGVDG
jgi:SAM-dependent methyltransferase